MRGVYDRGHGGGAEHREEEDGGDKDFFHGGLVRRIFLQLVVHFYDKLQFCGELIFKELPVYLQII